VWAAEGVELTDEQTDAVALLALVAGQDVEPGDGPGRWRIAQRTAPDRVISTVDPESRHVHKTQHSYRDGYKAHIAAEPDTGLITACALTSGNTGDAEAAPGLLAGEAPGTEVLGDSSHGTGELRQHLAERDMCAVIKPPPLRPAVAGGYTLDDFTIDETAGTVTCPNGTTVNITARRRARLGRHCIDCSLRSRCTTAARGRVIALHPHHRLLAAARAFAQTEAFTGPYRRHRPMVEHSIAWLVRGCRRLRYHGTDRNQLWLTHRVAAINLQRLINLGLAHRLDGWAIT
jgi:hypothetical protein